MAHTPLRKTSLESMEAEIVSLLKTLESFKDDTSDESRKTIKALKSNAENALQHSRNLLSDAYEEVKTRTKQTGIATRDYAQDHPWTTAGVAVGALGLLAAWLLCKRNH
ncbi:ElaB/YgaM/YqjD family protein [Pseudomonas sp. X10]